MNIIELTSLSEAQSIQIRELEQYCIAYDRSGQTLFLSNDINYHKDMPCFFLSYQEETLCGVLIVFAPTMETAEISAYVHPSNRKEGVFSGMLLAAWQSIHRFNINKVIMVTDAVATVCNQILKKWQAEYAHSEYLMSYQGGEKTVEFPFAGRCDVRDAKESDFDKMVEMNMASFDEDRENAAHMVRQNFKHNPTRCFVGLMEDEIFGLANVRKEESEYYICGFNIAPTHRGKGFGRYLLYQILNRLTPSEDETITLEVDSTNQTAYRLYITSGFVVQSQADYYRLSLPTV
jgi:ribosomal protein S18 acetylase RimI-like enzyme